MKTNIKRILTVSLILIIIGIIVCFMGCISMGFNFKRLDGDKITTNTHQVLDGFENISVDVNTADVEFVLSNETNCKVVCQERAKLRHFVTVENKTLKIGAKIGVNDTRKWYEHIQLFSFGQTKVTVYLPMAEFKALNIKTNTGDVVIPEAFTFNLVEINVDTGDVFFASSILDNGKVKISSDTGDVTVRNMTAGGVSVYTDTGDVELRAIKATNFEIKTDTGDVELDDVEAKESLFVKTSTGDVEFSSVNAPSITVNTNTGDVEGSVVRKMDFDVQTQTGNKRVPTDGADGKCIVTTDTGDVNLRVVE